MASLKTLIVLILVIFVVVSEPIPLDETDEKAPAPKVPKKKPTKKKSDEAPNPLLKADLTEPGCKFDGKCKQPWVLVEGFCLFVDLSINTTWNEGRTYCKKKHATADLAIFQDANEFAEILRHIRTLNSAKRVAHIWLGGTDDNDSGTWLWINGNPLPLGSPYWGGDSSGHEQPEPKDKEHCTLLYFHNRYYIHDANCKEASSAPLCQYKPLQSK